MEEKNLTLEEFRTELVKMASAHGRTLKEEMDEIESVTHSKAYADAMRELYGVPVTPA